jgi:hypothetical protein
VRSPRPVDPKARWGQVEDRWGNLVLAEGAMDVDDLFRFGESGPDGPVYRVSRVLPFPQDPGKRLYYYLRTTDNPTDS